MFYVQSTAKGLISGQNKMYSLPQVNSDSQLTIQSTIEDLENFGENEVEWAGKAETR